MAWKPKKELQCTLGYAIGIKLSIMVYILLFHDMPCCGTFSGKNLEKLFMDNITSQESLVLML